MKLRTRQYLSILFLLALALPASAQQAKPAQSTAPDSALLKKHVAYLASDELEGRRPGTAGADKAAAYLAEQFHQLKLGCASSDFKCRHEGKKHTGYLQEFPFIASVELAKNNSMSFAFGDKNNAVALRDEWMPIGFSSNGGIRQAGLVFVGHGITAAELKHDDYANMRNSGADTP